MSPRVGFALSLLAACGIHAVFLLAPRAALVQGASIPTVELELTAVAGTAAPVPHPVSAPAAPQRSETPLPAPAAPAPAAPASAALVPPPGPAASGEEDTAAIPAPAATGTASAPGAFSEAGSSQGVAGNGGSPSSTNGPPGSATGSTPGAVFIPPAARSEILPSYPRSARRSGLEGVVRVTALVDESGTVTSAEVLVSSGHGSLDKAALEAVRHTSFTPALQDGKPVACRVVIPVRFKLVPGPG